jgi:hypothetical protein
VKHDDHERGTRDGDHPNARPALEATSPDPHAVGATPRGRAYPTAQEGSDSTAPSGDAVAESPPSRPRGRPPGDERAGLAVGDRVVLEEVQPSLRTPRQSGLRGISPGRPAPTPIPSVLRGRSMPGRGGPAGAPRAPVVAGPQGGWEGADLSTTIKRRTFHDVSAPDEVHRARPGRGIGRHGHRMVGGRNEGSRS